MAISALDDSPTVAAAWVQAVKHLKTQSGHRCYNLAYMITTPLVVTVGDRAIIDEFDLFAESAGRHSVTTIANTIFPLGCYRIGGAARVFDAYHQEVYPYVKAGWGNYFERMTRRRDVKGNFLLDRDGTVLNPLKSLTAKLAARVAANRGSTTHYELPVSDEVYELATYDPGRDHRYWRGGPCLSHLSFKLEGTQLRLSAFYRSHFYLERALGNLVGLARLQSFVAKEANSDVGPLTIIASEACLESRLGTATSAQTAAFLESVGV